LKKKFYLAEFPPAFIDYIVTESPECTSTTRPTNSMFFL